MIKVKKTFIMDMIEKIGSFETSEILEFENVFDFYDKLMDNNKYIECKDFIVVTVLQQFLNGEDVDSIVIVGEKGEV